jgi:hypothetical protein
MFERLQASPAAINRMAALHISGGDRTGREELLWDQHDRYHNIAAKIKSEPSFRGDLKQHAKLYDAICKLALLKPGTFYHKDYKQHVKKLWAKTHGGYWGKNSSVRLNEALARARKRYESMNNVGTERNKQ